MGSQPKCISASRGAAVLGFSEWNTPLDIWLKIMEEREPGFIAKHGYKVKPDEENAAMRWGLAFEDEICRLVTKRTNKDVIHREGLYHLSEHDYITCHIDGACGERLQENKTTNARTYYKKWGEPETDHIPRSYQIQVQHQMMCTGFKYCDVNVLVFPKMVDEFEELGAEAEDVVQWASILADMGYFHTYHIEADREVQDMMLDKYKTFWNKNVLGRLEPTPQNYEDIKKLVIEPKGTIIANEQEWRWANEYRDLTDEIKFANKRKNELKTLLIKSMMDKAEVPIDNDSVEKFIMVDPKGGRKLCTYNGKTFR